MSPIADHTYPTLDTHTHPLFLETLHSFAREEQPMALRRSITAVKMRFNSPSISAVRRGFSSDGDGLGGNLLFSTEKPSRPHLFPEDLHPTISHLASQLLSLPLNQTHDDDVDVSPTLDSAGASTLLERSPDGAAFVELLNRLKSQPNLALKVFHWRRKQADETTHPLQPEEYSKAIALAGRARNVDLAAKLFSAAASQGLVITSTYNALMAVYMYNGITKRSMSVFDDLKRDKICAPTIVTYNILLSIFGRSMLVDHMETILQVIKKSKLVPDVHTYNTLIAGYLSSWMWDKMDIAFMEMKQGRVQPDASTYLLMLRGYAHSGNLHKMESVYELVKELVNGKENGLLWAMICAYCKSSDPGRVRKIEELMEHIPREDYRPWLNVHLIKLYADEGLIEKMDSSIHEAFSRNTAVTTSAIMRSIITNYFRNDAVDQLTEFVRRAESAGWKLCRSLYHCRMVLYARHQRFTEMENVVNEMESFKIYPCRRSYLILRKAFSGSGKNSEADRIFGLMWKLGFEFTM